MERSRNVPEGVIEIMFNKMKQVYKDISQEIPSENIIDIIPSKDQNIEEIR